MRNTLLPIIVAVLLFIFGVSVLNMQLWYSARAGSLSGARYVASDIDVILDEATHATSTASDITRKGCDQEGQYRLGTEAALQPHLRTILIYREGKIWCSSLPENGFVIALDDFGTGYSGLSYLHDLHIDYIKIDQSFVARVSMEEDSTRILDCVLDLARKLSLSIVAEGVETKAQVDYLNRNDITFQQGYYFFKPVNFTELIKIILSKPKVKVVVE